MKPTVLSTPASAPETRDALTLGSSRATIASSLSGTPTVAELKNTIAAAHAKIAEVEALLEACTGASGATETSKAGVVPDWRRLPEPGDVNSYTTDTEPCVNRYHPSWE